jgi:hypothetical protein
MNSKNASEFTESAVEYPACVMIEAICGDDDFPLPRLHGVEDLATGSAHCSKASCQVIVKGKAANL